MFSENTDTGQQPDNSMNRRQFLTGTALLGTATVAGCLGSNDNDPSPEAYDDIPNELDFRGSLMHLYSAINARDKERAEVFIYPGSELEFIDFDEDEDTQYLGRSFNVVGKEDDTKIAILEDQVVPGGK